MDRLTQIQNQLQQTGLAKSRLQQSFDFRQNLLDQTNSYAGSDIDCLIFIPAEDKDSNNLNQSNTDQAYIQIEDRLQTITVSSARSVSPIRRLGETAPIAYGRGSRTIAGSMIFTSGLRDAFIDTISKSVTEREPINEPVLFVDQIPKFSMVLQASNEFGNMSSALLINITLTNFGTTFSIDDIYTESTFTYVAEQYMPLSKVPTDKSQFKNEIINMKNALTVNYDKTIDDLIEERSSILSAKATKLQQDLDQYRIMQMINKSIRSGY